MKISIVGGGFTGCAAAIYLARKGHQITLWESTDQLGGILQDLNFENAFYLNGCQYLDKGFVDLLGGDHDLLKFPHEYAGLTVLNNTRIQVTNDCAQPTLEGNVKLSEIASIEGSALERLTAYGNHSHELIEWAKPFGNLAQIDWRCLIPMQLSRVYFPNDLDVPALKKKCKRNDDLLLIPRQLQGKMPEPAWLPKNGYTYFFKNIEKVLIDLGVDIRRQSPVKPLLDKGQIRIVTRNESINSDAIVWTSNPQPLLSRVYGIKLHTPPISMKLLVGDICNEIHMPVKLPFYWQIFDKKSSIVRLFIYKLGDKIRFSAESFDTVDNASTWKELQDVMSICGLGKGHSLVSVINQKRYVNFSTYELKIFQTLTPLMQKNGLISGGWQYFGREEKLTHIFSMFDQFSFLKNKEILYV
jgi:hypothetical protein